MRGLGTIINIIAVIVGGCAGLCMKKGLKKRFQDTLMQACGVAVVFIGAVGALPGLLSMSENGVMETRNTMLLIFSLVIGAVIGEAIDIEMRMEQFGTWLKAKVGAEGEATFVEGFVTTSLIICVGAMAIVGSLQDGLTGDYTLLVSKAVLDAVIVMVFAATLGVGAVFSALSIGIFQGSITILAVFISKYVTDTMISYLSCIGSVLIFCVGINLLFGKKIKVGNLLPALIVPVIYVLCVS